MASNFQDEHSIETYKSLVQISIAGLKLLALFNGGAAVALLAYLGNIAGKGVAAPDVRFPDGLLLARSRAVRARVLVGLPDAA